MQGRSQKWRILVASAAIAWTAACARAPARGIREVDLDAWRGVPVIELETHALFSTLPRSVRHLSDGSQLWTFSNCRGGVTDTRCGSYRTGNFVATNCSGGEAYQTCCQNQFIIRDAVVEQYRPVGHCYTDCTTRPASRECGAESTTFSVSAPRVAPEDARLKEVRRSPKAPEIGATVAEARVICEQERGRFVEREAVIGCRVGEPAIFACQVEDGQAVRCDIYFEGGDLVAHRASAEKQIGPPGSETVSPDGFRVYDWPQAGYRLTMYPKGVRVTRARIVKEE
jgi:hypothetical protein